MAVTVSNEKACELLVVVIKGNEQSTKVFSQGNPTGFPFQLALQRTPFNNQFYWPIYDFPLANVCLMFQSPRSPFDARPAHSSQSRQINKILLGPRVFLLVDTDRPP
jgi:hypothetical protein